ncbi:MAG TPA: DUF1080 domain-containing protein [Thermoguttaceae bacterium]|nr:DUF1080 domain-containing protein [Thermoguttaceae bacterium]
MQATTNAKIRRSMPLVSLLLFLAVAAAMAAAQVTEWTSGILWPKPPVVDPGPADGPPSDAVVLFDGKDLSQWDGGERWLVQDGVATARGGDMATKKSFGDCQLHVEWAAPEKIAGTDQARGNSGVYLMGRYEVQILDSYQNDTYHDGQAGAIYKQSPPMVNACRPPGRWQTFNIIFHAPRFADDGRVERPAAMTVLHNGVVVQDHFELAGETSWNQPPAYKPHADRLPIKIQYHGDPVRFRNIWVRELTPLVGVKRETTKDAKNTKR